VDDQIGAGAGLAEIERRGDQQSGAKPKGRATHAHRLKKLPPRDRPLSGPARPHRGSPAQKVRAPRDARERVKIALR
jgi:hypothetical protein